MNILVTGANRGLGLEFTSQLAARGDTVWATARSPQEAQALQALAKKYPGKVHVHTLDVGSGESVSAFVSQLGDVALDVLINNAGMYPKAGALGELDYDAFTQGFEVNTVGPIRLAEALVPHLKKAAGAKVMSVTSQMGSIADNGSGGAYAYRISKAALNMGMRSMAHDLADQGITVFVVHPGWVQTDMGGPNAKIDAPTSVGGMLRVLDAAGPQDAGRFKNWDGSELPW